MRVADADFSRIVFRSALAALILLGLSACALVWTLHGWHLARQDLRMRTMWLCASIGTALLAAFLMAIAMHQLDRPLMGRVVPWYLRVTLEVNKRIILIGQLVATVLALASLFLLAFNYRIPAI